MSPFDFTVYETIGNDQITVARYFAVSRKHVAVGVTFLIRITGSLSHLNQVYMA